MAGRPSLAEARREEILDAFARCVIRYGLEGSSLERIAEEAGMRRSILRHYVGNRIDLVRALCDRVVQNDRDDLDQYFQAIRPEDRIKRLLELLVPSRPRETTASLLVIESLIAAGDDDPVVQQKMREYVDQFVKRVAEQLRLEYPNRSPQQCWRVAYGAVAICFNEASLVPLDLPNRFSNASRHCVQVLLDSLRD